MVITTCGDRPSAKKIADALIQERLAACAQLFPIESVYLWKGDVCNEEEILVLIKSRSEFFDKISEAIKKMHPYETPEIIEVPITNGLPQYLQWINDCIG